MKFIHPFNFKTIAVKKNPDVLYHYAIKHKTKKLEIRYSIWPMADDIIAYKKSKNEPNLVLTNPNDGFFGFTSAVVMNIAQGKIINYVKFKTKDVKKDFNADEGGSFYVEAKSQFGKGYKFAMIVALFKKDTSKAYIIYLFDDLRKISKELLYSFESLQFK